MSRTAHKKEFHHSPTTHELLMSLESMPKWIDVMLNHVDKPFCPFIKWYSEIGFSKGLSGKLTVKQLHTGFGKGSSGKITKWIAESYEELLDLHLQEPELFKENTGLRQHYYIKYYSDAANLTMWLPVVPRAYEEIRIPFLRAKFGLDHFWVDKVHYEISDEEMAVSIWLKGGFPNPYMDMLYNRAVFEGHLHFLAKYDTFDFQIEEKLLQLYTK